MKKVLSSTLVVGLLGLQGCAVEAMNAFQLVGSAVQGGLAMSGSIAEANEKEKKAEEVKSKPVETDYGKSLKAYFAELDKIAEDSDIYCKEQWKHYNKCVAVANGKVLQGWNFHFSWSSNEGWVLFIFDDKNFSNTMPTQAELDSIKTGGIEFYSQRDIHHKMYKGYTLLGKGVSINNFKRYMPEYGGMRPSSVLKAVNGNQDAYMQLAGI